MKNSFNMGLRACFPVQMTWLLFLTKPSILIPAENGPECGQHPLYYCTVGTLTLASTSAWCCGVRSTGERLTCLA